MPRSPPAGADPLAHSDDVRDLLMTEFQQVRRRESTAAVVVVCDKVHLGNKRVTRTCDDRRHRTSQGTPLGDGRLRRRADQHEAVHPQVGHSLHGIRLCPTIRKQRT